LQYKNQVLEEMDLDGLLARRPQIALVGELAHANAPGSRHPKRYLDVEELLNAGIDVYATLNIQHIESVNDVVAPFTALSVETKRTLRLSDEQRDCLAETLRLAQSLGGEAITVPGGARIADDVLAFARANNVTQIVIGKSARSRWFEIVNGSVVHHLVRRSGNISVHVIAGDDISGEPLPGKTVHTAERPAPFRPNEYVIALLAVGAALGIGKLIMPWIGLESVDLVFLTAIVALAVRFS
jgi:K+-sensing histidine kinase KdpD